MTNATAPTGSADRPQRIQQRLAEGLPAHHVEVIDDSHLHAGHVGARDGKGHFRVRVVSDAFDGLKLIQRHQLVYRALGDMMQSDIHALSITALTPREAG